ncbi:hypothetical protein BRC83_05390 [Halobacteriales archaeon QS_1_68_17]|nr:MAG: hypothetical protein BRC83_05390 [Halobacteriales archaeon QS_1_68_17]
MRRRHLLALAAGVAAAGCSGRPALREDTDRHDIDYGDSVRYDLDVRTPFTLEYDLRVLAGPPVDVVVVAPEHVENFLSGEQVPYANGATQFDTDGITVQANVWAGRWAVLIANGAGADGTGERATASFHYRVRRYVPYGSGDEAGPS